MAYEQKENSGSIFKNQKKEKDTHPNMTGSALIGGVEYWVSAWTKDGNKGKWQSLSFTPKESRIKTPAADKKQRPTDDSDAIPF
jgi:hypothetical protein